MVLWKGLVDLAQMGRRRDEATPAEIIDLLQAKALRENTRKLSVTAITCDPLCPSKAVIKRVFVTVNNAIRAAGLYPSKGVTPEDLIRSLHEFYQTNGRKPTCAEATNGWLIYSRMTYEAVFGSWNAALLAAGFEICPAMGGPRSIRKPAAAIIEFDTLQQPVLPQLIESAS